MDDDVTQWLSGLARGEESAIRQVWQRYYERLVQLARRKLGDASRRVADEEDAVLSAFESFCEGAAAGRFPRLEDRDDLWKLLVTLTARKAQAQIRRSHRIKRGSGRVRGESVFAHPAQSDEGLGLGAVLGREPTPELAAMVAEQCSHLLACLPEEQLRQIALAKLEGYQTEEIAAQLGCAPRTVERRLARIRECWQEAHLDGR